MIFETHAHYEDEKFDPDRVELLSSMEKNRIGRIINVGSSMSTSIKSVELAHQYDYIYAAVGLHPDAVMEYGEENVNQLRELCKDPKVVAIGEIGPDYHYEKDEEVRKLQIKAFQGQLELAKEVNLPVIVHSREAAKDTMDILSVAAKQGIRGVVHCYSYSKEQALQYADMGYYIGVGGVLTFKNGKKLRETVLNLPLDRILLETDCPYMSPEPFRGQRNDSTRIPYVVQTIAEMKGLSTEEVEDVTWKNAMSLFGRVQR